MYIPKVRNGLLIILLLITTIHGIQAQKKNRKSSSPTLSFDESLYKAMEWRNIGPFRGGRCVTVAGHAAHPITYYMGSTGGGVWKTVDGGNVWKNISDGFFKTGSVGAIAVAESDPNVIYVGMGEAPVRGVMTSHGDGVYKSLDAGKSWKHMGLPKVRQISAIRIHPQNPDLVFVAAQGSPYAPTNERGVYRSSNGGESWQRVHFVDEKSGVSDLSMDPINPRVLYAAYWEHQRVPWKVISGGPGSGIYKSTDGGENWKKLSKGLPETMGKIGVSVSPANPQRVFAIVESEKGGLYRSDDAGENWRLINGDRILQARSWYYMHVFADPVDENKVVVLNAPFLRSIDGGKSFQPVRTPHGDNHALWVNPKHPEIMINGNDGGANISFNGGASWSTQGNQPTAQFYRVNADNQIPYYVYGGQQDNSTVAIPSRTATGGIKNSDFYQVGGCESAYTAFDPDDPTRVYAGCYQGIITEYNTNTHTEKDIMAYPYLGLGSYPSDVKYRFNWNAPILMSRHDRNVIYHAGNVLLKSTNRGLDWTVISPDLTRNDSSHFGPGGGPITNEGAGGEVYHTIFYIAESHQDAQTIWAGTDDGLVHITRDGGSSWTNITPPNIGEAMINAIELSPHDLATAYLAVNKYKFNDFTPHIYKTTDFGKNWQRLVDGIAQEAHVRVVREDPERKDLLYAGTETGLYISFDGAQSWKKFQLNLPIVPITDLKVHKNDLIAATQGRAFWILDDLSPLHQLNREIADKDLFIYNTRHPYLYTGGRANNLTDRGTNPENGAVFYYYLKDSTKKSPTARIVDKDGHVIRSLKNVGKKMGMNKLVWNFRVDNYEGVKGLQVFTGLSGYRKGPGEYRLEIVNGDDSLDYRFNVYPDPRYGAAMSSYNEQQDKLENLRNAIDGLYTAIKDLRFVKAQIETLTGRPELGEDSTLKKMGEDIIASIDQLQKELIQAKQKTFQDVVNFPNKLDANLIHIQRTIDGSPPPLTSGQRQRVADLLEEWERYEAEINELLEEDVEAFNKWVLDQEIPILGTQSPENASESKR